MLIRAVLIDDEASNRDVLRKLLTRFCPEVEIVGEAAHANAGYELIHKVKPDLVFLDIQMPQGNAFSMLNKFSTIDFRIIFVTSYDQYAVKAIKFSALDYLLKPVEVDDLIQAVERAKSTIIKTENQTSQVVHLLNNAKEVELEKSLAIHDRGKVRFIRIGDIAFMESDVNYAIIHLQNGEKIVTSRILKELEEVLEDYKLFLRINKSCIVNVNCVTQYSKKEPYTLTLKGGQEFEISRRKKQEVNERLDGL
ncbi:MAG: LytTR family DNA-binding domain-containing protein [Flavobacteriales bacterium]|nr:LytTR family DNA-binding domain-containing protein [Flavobacteriales bacterium]